jgi:hypothetical protein
MCCSPARLWCLGRGWSPLEGMFLSGAGPLMVDVPRQRSETGPVGRELASGGVVTLVGMRVTRPGAQGANALAASVGSEVRVLVAEAVEAAGGAVRSNTAQPPHAVYTTGAFLADRSNSLP